MKVKDLKALLADVPDDAEVVNAFDGAPEYGAFVVDAKIDPKMKSEDGREVLVIYSTDEALSREGVE